MPHLVRYPSAEDQRQHFQAQILPASDAQLNLGPSTFQSWQTKMAKSKSYTKQSGIPQFVTEVVKSQVLWLADCKQVLNEMGVCCFA